MAVPPTLSDMRRIKAHGHGHDSLALTEQIQHYRLRSSNINSGKSRYTKY